jgi:hypothetical protein
MNTEFNLDNFFTPTVHKCKEINKARVKNANLPFLQYMYHGDPEKSLHCLITKNPGFVDIPDFGTGEQKQRFTLDFNHIRQRCTDARQAGNSVDKGHHDPSHIFRSRYLDPNYRGPNYKYNYRQRERELDVFEFMCIMPITSEIHSYITQDSAKSNITLKNFPKETWALCLQNEDYFETIKKGFNIQHFDYITYDWFIDHLSNIEYDSIRTRLMETYNEKHEAC